MDNSKSPQYYEKLLVDIYTQKPKKGMKMVTQSKETRCAQTIRKIIYELDPKIVKVMKKQISYLVKNKLVLSNVVELLVHKDKSMRLSSA